MKNVSMKNVIMGSVLAIAAVTPISANAAAAQFCSGGVAGNGATATFATDGTSFVKSTFTPKCSANVFLSGDDTSATVYRVGAGSAKGRTRFMGSSVGGAVGPATTSACTGTGGYCAAGDASAAAGEAATS